MAQREPTKISNLQLPTIPSSPLEQFIVDLDYDIKNLFEYARDLTPTTYSQSAEPDIGNDNWAFWKDTDDGKFYLIKDIGGTQKKVELT